ncbi:MAG TPA: hypothetical protein PKD09_10515 [Aggregatilinea sp.]|uniref:hypothetical protein n=1 Tax=Aggregatilinea sp. TaxID=2806333 RepID=UPI002BE4C4A8|nr:hypothetical protein [Aggregatilinea sp.]HML22075.1 hypothetical protein [Aggregatilinea sp.]
MATKHSTTAAELINQARARWTESCRESELNAAAETAANDALFAERRITDAARISEILATWGAKINIDPESLVDINHHWYWLLTPYLAISHNRDNLTGTPISESGEPGDWINIENALQLGRTLDYIESKHPALSADETAWRANWQARRPGVPGYTLIGAAYGRGVLVDPSEDALKLHIWGMDEDKTLLVLMEPDAARKFLAALQHGGRATLETNLFAICAREWVRIFFDEWAQFGRSVYLNFEYEKHHLLRTALQNWLDYRDAYEAWEAEHYEEPKPA